MRSRVPLRQLQHPWPVDVVAGRSRYSIGDSLTSLFQHLRAVVDDEETILERDLTGAAHGYGDDLKRSRQLGDRVAVQRLHAG
jgi:hypothetical protein